MFYTLHSSPFLPLVCPLILHLSVKDNSSCLPSWIPTWKIFGWLLPPARPGLYSFGFSSGAGSAGVVRPRLRP